ncbi:hypothetical protein CWI38_0323p0010 [Hamiltosporidium tvaerminnensis]|uniref:Uncharacterized protein n=2 Tax=Hamiltosporidium tvaerminnensis TaxID=1176355 RepID=A0A4Q9LYB8_9MICR|nr:hypothetical protein CWI38_0323p0010 [Hamiltosporidium tvaerminnensis]
MIFNQIRANIYFFILYILLQFLTIQTEIIVRFHLKNDSIKKVEESDRKFIEKKSFLNFCSKFLTVKKESVVKNVKIVKILISDLILLNCKEIEFHKKNDGLEIDIDLSKIYYSEFTAFHLYLKSCYFPNNIISFEEFVGFLVVLDELKVDFDAGFIKLIDTILFNLYNLFESSKYYLKESDITDSMKHYNISFSILNFIFGRFIEKYFDCSDFYNLFYNRNDINEENKELGKYVKLFLEIDDKYVIISESFMKKIIKESLVKSPGFFLLQMIIVLSETNTVIIYETNVENLKNTISLFRKKPSKIIFQRFLFNPATMIFLNEYVFEENLISIIFLDYEVINNQIKFSEKILK